MSLRFFALVAIAFLVATGVAAADRPVHIVLVGDSTVTDAAGWGAAFAQRLAPDVRCTNKSRGGASSKNYYERTGLWQETIALKPTHILIQFGHNDMPGKGPERETDPTTTFRDHLGRYVAEARAIGAQPVLVSSVTRRNFRDGKLVDLLAEYAAGAKAVAAAEKVPFVDLHAVSVAAVQKLGAAGSAEFGPVKDGQRDNTHFSVAGAEWAAGLVIAELQRALPESARWFAPASARAEPGFVILFDGRTFAGWKHAGNWVIENGAFYRKDKGGDLTYTTATVPDDFELRFEWKVSRGCNSGVYYRPGQYEYQVLDNVNSPYGENPRQSAASLFFGVAPSRDATRPLGEWNEGRVVAKGTVIQHWLNGEKVIDFDYTDPRWAKEVELLRIRGADLAARGAFLRLQDHGQDVWFRNLSWRPIPANEKLQRHVLTPMPVPPEALKKEQARVDQLLKAKKKK